jgi:hypothetical protein
MYSYAMYFMWGSAGIGIRLWTSVPNILDLRPETCLSLLFKEGQFINIRNSRPTSSSVYMVNLPSYRKKYHSPCRHWTKMTVIGAISTRRMLLQIIATEDMSIIDVISIYSLSILATCFDIIQKSIFQNTRNSNISSKRTHSITLPYRTTK